MFYPVAAAPGLSTLTAAGGNPLAPGTPNGAPITAATGLNVAAQAQAAINAAAAVSASAALHHVNPAVLSPHTNTHQLSVHHPAISPHLTPQHHIAANVPGQQQHQLSNHLNCTNFTNTIDGGGGSGGRQHAVSVATNSLQQPQQHRHHLSPTNHSPKSNLLQQQCAAGHQVTSNQTLLHQQPSTHRGSAATAVW